MKNGEEETARAILSPRAGPFSPRRPLHLHGRAAGAWLRLLLLLDERRQRRQQLPDRLRLLQREIKLAAGNVAGVERRKGLGRQQRQHRSNLQLRVLWRDLGTNARESRGTNAEHYHEIASERSEDRRVGLGVCQHTQRLAGYSQHLRQALADIVQRAVGCLGSRALPARPCSERRWVQ